MFGNMTIYEGYAYFATQSANLVTKINLADISDCVQEWATATDKLNRPCGLAVYQGFLYVCNKGDDTIVKI